MTESLLMAIGRRMTEVPRPVSETSSIFTVTAATIFAADTLVACALVKDRQSTVRLLD